MWFDLVVDRELAELDLPLLLPRDEGEQAAKLRRDLGTEEKVV